MQNHVNYASERAAYAVTSGALATDNLVAPMAARSAKAFRRSGSAVRARVRGQMNKRESSAQSINGIRCSVRSRTFGRLEDLKII